MAPSSKADKPVNEDLPNDSESDDSKDEEGWDDVDQDDEEVPEVISLLDDRVFNDINSMLAHCREKHGFDFLQVRRRLNLDFHGCVKLVNFIRHRVHEGLPVTEDIALVDIDKDVYLKPVLDDDAVIIGLHDLPELEILDPTLTDASERGEAVIADLLQRNRMLQERLESVLAQYNGYREDVSKTLDKRWGEVGGPDDHAGGDKAQDGADESGEDSSKYYYDSYAGVEIHETMLKDKVRTDAYRDFIYTNKHLFAGKTVLDIGCGTGILSMFCARAGAARVIAVDASDIISKARENVFRAGLSQNIVLLHGKMEEVVLPVEKVDIIVSEWMGYCLLFEAMLPSVLYARDRYLAPGGMMVPSHTNMWLAPVSDPAWIAENGKSFWSDVYGFDMSAMAKGLYDEARVLSWPSANICGRPSAFKMLDLYTVTADELTFTAPFTCRIVNDAHGIDGFLIWFDTFFSPLQRTQPTHAGFGPEHADGLLTSSVAHLWAREYPDRIAFTTSPFGPETHWKQGLLLVDPGANHETTSRQWKRDEDEISGEITFAAHKDNARALVIKASWEGGYGRQTWSLR
ncbi:S-adenosyl-L-methionine-dependent methyltransferase [Xylaria sp. CBS 124048]|nr:S-adenosyl-L-methionine-dependent methyltransferase [Xylaria sp. CBS 124048]